jgi:hypothetical protein
MCWISPDSNNRGSDGPRASIALPPKPKVRNTLPFVQYPRFWGPVPRHRVVGQVVVGEPGVAIVIPMVGVPLGLMRRAITLETRRDVGMARLHALRTAREVTQLMFDTIGAPAVYETIPFGSLLRDAVVINQHRVFSDDNIERLGGVMSGGSPDGIFV